MGIRIVEGRGFEDGDRAGAPPVAVVNEAFARQFFKDTRAIGQHLRVFDSDGSIEIVGIAKDVREAGLTGPIPAVMYVPCPAGQSSGRQRFAHLLSDELGRPRRHAWPRPRARDARGASRA